MYDSILEEVVMNKVLSICSLIGCLALLSACSSDSPDPSETNPYEEQYYSGGKLGTAFNNTATCYEQFTPAVAVSYTHLMGEALRRAGYTRECRRINGNPVYVYAVRKIYPEQPP